MTRQVLLFDLYGTLVDPITVSAALARTIPTDIAQDVARTWRRKQVEYAFRLTVMDRYRPFDWITARSLDFALLVHGQELDDGARHAVLRAYDTLEPYPDVAPALEVLAATGHPRYVLSNGSPDMVQRCLSAGGLAESFDGWISVDAVRAFKPSPQVYRHASDVLGRPIDELRLVSCNSFDVIGAAAAGMPTAWVNRSGGPFDTIGEFPHTVGRDLLDLARQLAVG